MLDNIGRRYLVEHWESTDGSQDYDLYSDGFIVQRCKFALDGGTLTFPKEFRNLNYRISIGTTVNNANTNNDTPSSRYIWGWFGISEKTTTGFKRGGNVTSANVNLDIIAQGYAA